MDTNLDCCDRLHVQVSVQLSFRKIFAHRNAPKLDDKIRLMQIVAARFIGESSCSLDDIRNARQRFKGDSAALSLFLSRLLVILQISLKVISQFSADQGNFSGIPTVLEKELIAFMNVRF